MKAIRFWITTALLAALMFFMILYGILLRQKGVFYTSYMNVINDKFDILMDTNEPKIIIVGGSNCAFGIDQDMIEKETGYKVANLGLHAGFGHLFYSELAKQNINPGDIVLLAYEYNWNEPDAFTDLGVDLIMSGIDDNISMYRYIPVKKLPSILGYVFSFAAQKRDFEPVNGIYSREAFDPKTTQIIMEIDGSYDFDPEVNESFNLSAEISQESKEYLTDLKNYIEERGAEVYFVSPPLAKDSIECDPETFDRLRELEESEIGIKYISSPEEYFFGGDLLFDTKYHCNTKGMELRTRLLLDDMKRAGAF